ncbi:hypothetical protein WHR41_02975 [Cladosporium halotolerans]|uniref:AP-3 complex subunit delta n=1 Tax=Cladosporium halotolerans TaxID=1052096 RepID=A0AB34KTT1_9PEZI
MFEKDVLQLIRGLRAHKGEEREYIQSSLRECKKEIKSNDMDQKATALLKLVYLEMFGHDMGWASFNVLEVMSSQKYPHKRVGYLAAVQSFRPDTEVLMLAENLLKKDLTSPDKNLIHLPLNAIPHLINPSMANSLLADLLPRLSHSHPAVRKKTIVTLYRLAVVYPETLRPAWPKIKERLLDEDEDPSVTAAIVNVVCELGWRRPQDFLPLAPHLFELLTQGGNNWMAIKIIKLFSQLAPLEPRLVRKLLPPLTSIIKTTPAMSLLYECINGIIQGGIMEVAAGTTEGDEVARLCVSKLRAMLVVQGDPNLRYVALLAFGKITASHADLVADHQDVILECIDDADISIRTRALDLVVNMVNSNNLQLVVERLLKQLKTAGKQSPVNEPENSRTFHEGVIPMADDDDEGTATPVKNKDQKSNQPPPLPEDYRQSVIERILEMCSKENYVNMDDFEWYITVLVELVKQCPSSSPSGTFGSAAWKKSMADAIGDELRNVAVRVKGVRPEAAAAAQSLLLLDNREEHFAQATENAQNVLSAAAFIAGEYAAVLPDAGAVMASLVHTTTTQLPTHALASYIQAIPKVFAALTSNEQVPWTDSRKSEVVLLIARITHFLEPLNLHPSLEIQERAVEYLDLMRLASEAVSAQQVDSENGGYAEPPLLLTQAIPSLFTGMDLNPVAPDAVRKVAAPESLDLNAPINSSLEMILQQAEYDTEYDSGEDEVRRFYYEKPSMVKTSYVKPASELLEDRDSGSASYQDTDRDSLLDPEALERKRAERRERYRDDPFYIDSERNSGTSTPMHNILRSANGSDLDVDAIPVMELKLDSGSGDSSRAPKPKAHKKPKRHFEITSDETIDGGEPTSSSAPISYSSSPSGRGGITQRGKKSLLEFNSAGLSALSLEDGPSAGSSSRGNAGSKLDFERRIQEEEELAKAMKEVERLRLEMQRQAERVEEPTEEGTVVKRKGRKKVRSGIAADEGQSLGGDDGIKKKKKKKKVKESEAPAAEASAKGEQEQEKEEAPVKPKKKKKRQVTFDE